jgi:hypothetical protein
MIFSSCGDMFTKKNNGNNNVGGIYGATCKLDTKAFSLILEKRIPNEIDCLKTQLDLFMTLVRTDRPGYMSLETLKQFLRTGPITDIDESMFGVLDAVFDLSYLILGGDRGYVSKDGVNKLISMLKYFNEHFWIINKLFSSPDTVNYERHNKERKEIYNEFVLISKNIRTIFNTNRSGEMDRIDTEVFLNNFFGETPETFNKITSLMFLKKIFFGGDRYDLTFLQLEDALYKLPELGLIAFDLIKAKKFSFSDDIRSMMSLYNKDVSLARNLLFYGTNSFESLFTIYDIFTALENMLPEFSKSLNLRKYPREVIELKSTLLDTYNGKHFSSLEIVKLFDHMTNIFDEGEFYFRVYDSFKDELNSTRPISVDFSSYPVRTERERGFLANFTRIVYDYRYVKGTFQAPFFSFENYRNPAGYMEIRALEYGVTLLMARHGRKNDLARGGYDMTLDHTIAFIHKIKRFLRDNGITTVGRVGGSEAVSTAENLVLMSTLFQNQSNGCDTKKVCMEVPEITEFLVGLVTALSVKDFFIEEMQKVCGNDVDEYGRIYVDCFRRNFVKVLKVPMKGDGRSLADYMPLLYSYIKELTGNIGDNDDPTVSAKYTKFLSETESFTRTCTHFDEPQNTESLPMKSTDAFAVFAGLLNVESTVLRFDTNQNNKMDGSKNHNEVLNAYYEVYEGAIKSLVAPNGGFMEKLAKPIFQYLVKYGQVPDTSQFKSLWAFAKFLLRVNKNADASRTTISTILKTLGEQSENAKLHPFKCRECLATPDTVCEPEDGSWDYDWASEENYN